MYIYIYIYIYILYVHYIDISYKNTYVNIYSRTILFLILEKGRFWSILVNINSFTTVQK